MTRAGQAEARDRGVFGLVADVVSAPAEYENAIEAVLGERLQYVIVESHSQGVEAIDYLKTAAEGRASLIPMARLRDADQGGTAADLGHPGVVASCLDVIRFEPSYDKVVRFLLGDALSSATCRRAGDLAAERRQADARDARRRGARPYGVVTGGPLEGEGHGALQRRREAQELEDVVRGFEADFSLAQERHRTLQARLLQLEAALKSPTRTAARRSSPSSTRRRTSPAWARSSSASASAWERFEITLPSRGGSPRSRARRRSTGRGHRGGGGPRGRRRQDAVERLELTRQRGDVLTAELMNLKVKVAADAERREGIGAALKRIDDARREVDERRARLFAALSEANARAAELRSRLDGTRVDSSAGAGRRRGARGALRARTEHEGRAVAPRARDAEARELRTRVEAARAAMGEAALTGREQALALTHLEEQTRERCQAELKWEVSRFHLERPPGDAERERLDELKGQAERMGAINLTAIEEYDEPRQPARVHEHAEGRPRASARRSQGRDREDQPRLARAVPGDVRSRERVVPGGLPAPLQRRARRAQVTQADGDGEPGVEIFSQPPGKEAAEREPASAARRRSPPSPSSSPSSSSSRRRSASTRSTPCSTTRTSAATTTW